MYPLSDSEISKYVTGYQVQQHNKWHVQL